MSIERDEAIISINEAKEKIINIKEKLEEKNDQLPKLKDLKEQFDNIYCILGKRQTDLQKDLKELSFMIDTINEKQAVLLNERTEVMVATIRANLPNGMRIEPQNNNIKKGILTYENKNIGEIEIIQKNDCITVNVSINDFDYESFIVVDELGMYTIINYIITKFNYD
jgi:chromosome segregation ATPase